METKKELKNRPNKFVRHIRLLKRKQYKLNAYLDEKNNVRFNDTPIPHQINHLLKNTNYSHGDFTGLYFKYSPYYWRLREALFITTLQAGPTKSVNFIKTLAEKSKDKIAFYRQIKFEFIYFLNKRILPSKKDYIEHFANTLWGEKFPKDQAEFITREILVWTDKYLSKQESLEISMESNPKIGDTTEPINSPQVENEIQYGGLSTFSWKSYTGNKKDFLMFCLIPILSGGLQEKPGFTKRKYLERMGQIFDIEIPKNSDSNISSAIEQGSYHEIINDAIRFLKKYEKEYLNDQKKRGRNGDSGIDYQGLDHLSDN